MHNPTGLLWALTDPLMLIGLAALLVVLLIGGFLLLSCAWELPGLRHACLAAAVVVLLGLGVRTATAADSAECAGPCVCTVELSCRALGSSPVPPPPPPPPVQPKPPVQPPLPPAGTCTPPGFALHALAWERAFYGNPYPSSGAPLAPLGSFTTGKPAAGRVIAVQFTAAPGVFLLNWLQPQPIPEHRYGRSRVPRLVNITISPCPGAVSSPHRACNKIASAGSLYYSGTKVGYNVCPVTPGQRYFLNFLFADPRDGLTADEHTCMGGESSCEVNVRHERQSL